MTDLPRIAILIGSTRPGRKGAAVGEWVHKIAAERTDARFEVLDLAAYDLPLLSEPTVPGAANGVYECAQTQAWSATVTEFDGFVWVTPEYNHGVPAAMKNALDVLFGEWNHKAVGFVSYGADGGVRAVEHWRAIVANVLMVGVRGQVALSLFQDWDGAELAPAAHKGASLTGMLDQLVATTGALKPLRSA